MTQHLGFDKSSYDGTVNWTLAKSRGISWATIRASYGSVKDNLYETEKAKAIENGIKVVPYHWYIPKRYSPTIQVSAFLTSALGSNMPAMLDLEDSGFTAAYVGVALKELKIWLDMVDNAVGAKTFIYSSPSYIKSYLFKDTWLSEYPLIIAHYRVSAPLIPKPWTPINLAGWQFGGDDSDAKYYGFEQTLGCSLQIMYDMEKYAHEWSIQQE
jgi:GH25 family lysozyme M1 (1,4-beta-N-acetylmuramidase)